MTHRNERACRRGGERARRGRCNRHTVRKTDALQKHNIKMIKEGLGRRRRGDIRGAEQKKKCNKIGPVS